MLSQLKPKIEKYFTDPGHEFDHTERVYKLAVRIAKEENADLDVIKAAALLHDVGRHKEDPEKGICHAEESAKIAPEILKSINFPEEKVSKVVHAIKVHRYSKQLKAETKEAEILQDADRLDALGAIVIGRVFARGGSKHRPIHDPGIEPEKEYNVKTKAKTSMSHFYQKILKIKPETFKTKLAQKIAKERYAYVKDFVERFEKEWKGEDG
ncbi:HD domain-containing protein [Candidatus Woesearchaeota archaeon]|nr:HD domain-containing protein [Candidatus Woesearchaeota archaeon]